MDLPGDGRVVKRLRVAVEGQTVDGRNLSADEIKQMALVYDPELYAARINCEHIAGFSPEAPFNAYGDVVAVDAAEENGKWVLYNTISALPNLQAMNQAGQKIYPSIEFYRDFRGSGIAYQVGLALTDTPASTGTQPLKLSRAPGLLNTQPAFFLELSMSQAQQTQASPERSLLEKFAAFVGGAPITPPAAPAVQLTAPAAPATANPAPAVDPAQQLAQLEDRIVDKLVQRLSQHLPVAPDTTPAVQTAQATAPAAAPAAQPAALSADQMMMSMLTLLTQQNQTLVAALSNQPGAQAAPTITGSSGGLTDC